ncbi:unnamed protein product, partial [Ectocarpus sp. 12 AP-2014]
PRLAGSTTLYSEDDGQDVSDLLVVKSSGSDQRDVLASASAQTAPIVDSNGDSPNLPVVLPPHEAAEKEPGQDDGSEGTEVESQRLPNQDEASAEGDHPEEETMTNGLSRPSSPRWIGARHVATHDEPQIRGDSAPGTPASAASDMLSWVEYKYFGIAVAGMLLLVLTVKSRVGMKVVAAVLLAMSLARGRVPHGRVAEPRHRHPSRVGRVALVVKIAVVDVSRALVSWVSERDWVRSTSAWTGAICTYVALAAFGMFRSDVTSRTKNWLASVLTRAFSVARNQVSRARAVDLPTWLTIVEETWMSLSVVILAATSKIAPIDESSPCMKMISKSDMAEWNAWWYEYRWVVVGMLMPLFLGVMRMVMNDIISMTMLAMCRVRGRLPQGRAARPYHWHTMRPAVVAVVAKIVVVDGLWALVWWVSKQVAANFLSGWREVLCWSVVLGSGAYMRSYTLDVMSSVTNGMAAVGAWVYSTGFHQRSPGRRSESPRWHPFRAATAIFTAGLVAMVVDCIAETGGWSALVVRAARGVTAFRGRLPLTFQLVSVSWRTLGVAAAAAALMAWVMVVYVAAAGFFFVCTNRMTFPIRILVRIFELYDKWGEPNTLQLALRVGLHRNVLCHAHGTDASLKAAVFSVLSRLEPGDDYTQVLLVARSFQDQCDLSVLFHEFAARTDKPMTVSVALHPDWQQEVRSQVVIGTASTLSILLDRGLLDPSNVTAFAVDLGNDDSSLQEERRSSARALFSVWAFAALCYAGYWVLPLAFPSFTSSVTAFVWELFVALGRVAVSTAGLVATLLCGLSALLVHATTVILVLPSFTAGLLAATVGLVGTLLRGLCTSLVHPSTVIRVFSSFVGGLPAATVGVFATLWCGLSAVVVYVTTIIRVLTPYVGGLAAATAEVVVILSQALFAVVVPVTATVIRGLSVCAYGLVGLLKIVVSLWSELAVTAMAGRLLWILGRQEQRLSTPATATLAVASCRAASDTTNACVPKGKVDGSAASNTTNACVPKGKVDGSAASDTTNACGPKG